MGRLVVPALAAALVLGATACGERSEPTGPSQDLYPVTIQTGDRPLVLPHPARRIAVIAPSLEVIVTDLGASFRVAGTPLAPNGTVRVATLRRLRPDLIVASTSTPAQERERAAAAAPSVPLYTAPDDSIIGVERTITQLGLVTDESVAARVLVHRIEADRAIVHRRLTGVPGVSVFLDVGFFTTVSNQSLAGDMLREVHALNVAGSKADAAPFDLLTLRRLDPRYYLATSDSGTTLAQLRRNQKTRTLGAVRAGRFAIVDSSTFDPGPGIGAGILRLARLLHPNAFR
jgi:ABC-type Fe3+-hydroxamate transport system substrate-binding protein